MKKANNGDNLKPKPKKPGRPLTAKETPNYNLLPSKPLKPEKSMGDYVIKGSNSGTTGRLRKNGGPIKKKRK